MHCMEVPFSTHNHLPQVIPVMQCTHLRPLHSFVIVR
jgi:hypothetical protein